MVYSIILAAGRGTRMRDDSLNKVCFECAGIPVIRRIVLNMKEAGVSRIVVVVGHMAQDVMDALDGIDGVVFTYQKVQNGTGAAAMLGLKALVSMGCRGHVIISMGDRVISADVIRDYIRLAEEGSAVYGVHAAGVNPSGGRVAERGGRACGIFEFADAAMLSAWPFPRETWEERLRGLGMSEGKIPAVVRRAEAAARSGGWQVTDGRGTVTLAGETFTAEELLHSRYTNASLYCFDIDSAIEVLGSCTPRNAQGEVYVTDTMEKFALRGDVRLYVIKNEHDILTYSTKQELIRMSHAFMRSAGERLAQETDPRRRRLLEVFRERFGDEKTVIARSPGRVNILGRHIDHRGGWLNVMALDCNTLLAVSPREDRKVFIRNTDPAFAEFSFDIDTMLAAAPHDDWVSYIESEPIRRFVADHRGAWTNYFMASVLRFQLFCDIPLCGMNIVMDGNIPISAGLSSSSSIVVAAAEAVTALNCLHISKADFIELCGEGEWFVGTRGGAGDQAAMKCSEKGHITQLGFKPFYVGSSEAFSDDYAVIVADSGIKSNKAVESRSQFNARIAAYEIAFMLMKKYYPEYNMVELRDAAAIRPYADIYWMLKRLPETATRREIFDLMPENRKRLEQIFSSHEDPLTYDLRGVALFGISECARSRSCLDYLAEGDYAGLGRLMKVSHDGDRVTGAFPLKVTDSYLIRCAEKNADVALQPGAYACSLPQIDALCDMLNATEGVLGSQMLGAGLGGCVAVLVRLDAAAKVLDKIEKEYYDPAGLPHLAKVYRPQVGSGIAF